VTELRESDVDPDPMVQFQRWFEEAETAEPMPEAMALATVGPDGAPSVRMVLLKGADHRGFVFHTSYESRKGRELAANSRAAIVVYWHGLHRQVRAEGAVSPLSAEESDAYFRTRPRGAQVAATASPQSEVLADREQLLRRVIEVERQFEGTEVPRPATWGGYRLAPDVVELWQGQEHRLHDRLQYVLDPQGEWTIQRLAP
jgi:pyridoxamine 5'-phosphate oxidase